MSRTTLQLNCFLLPLDFRNQWPIVQNFACIQKKKDTNTTEIPQDAIPPSGPTPLGPHFLLFLSLLLVAATCACFCCLYNCCCFFYFCSCFCFGPPTVPRSGRSLLIAEDPTKHRPVDEAGQDDGIAPEGGAGQCGIEFGSASSNSSLRVRFDNACWV